MTSPALDPAFAAARRPAAFPTGRRSAVPDLPRFRIAAMSRAAAFADARILPTISEL
ncbi:MULTISPECIES: hypothetical protein [unclassified Bradyrhizobium]